MKIKVKYFNNVEPIKKINKGDWIDLRCAEDITITNHGLHLIPLGVAMELPEGYEAHVLPRSSTYKNYNLLEVNSMGVIDESYCGDNDQWFMPVMATRVPTFINKNDRICQFRIMEKMPEVEFETVEELGNTNRGGFGSTGTK